MGQTVGEYAAPRAELVEVPDAPSLTAKGHSYSAPVCRPPGELTLILARTYTRPKFQRESAVEGV